MMPKHGNSYIIEKLWLAMLSLAKKGSPQKRIANAWLQGGYRLDAEAFTDPGDRGDFEAICAAFSTHQDDSKGAIVASAEAMSDDEAAEVARKIVELLGSFVVDVR